MSDTTKYPSTKFNITSTILQSTTKKKVLDSLIFSRALHHVDQNKNPANSKITIPNYRCAPFP